MKEKFSWLHLSDLHVGLGDQGYLWPRFEYLFLKDIEALSKKSDGLDAVLFSGDLTQSATVEEFDKLSQIIDRIWSVFNRAGFNPQLVSVPGNHDLVRPSARSPITAALSSYWENQEVGKQLLSTNDSEYRPFIFAAFKNYLDWRQREVRNGRHLSPTMDGILPGDALYEIKGAAASVKVVALNSTWLQLTPGDYRQRLNVHPHQLLELTSQSPDVALKDSDFKLLLTHHPADWLHKKALALWNNDIYPTDRFDLHLFGHMHDPQVIRNQIGGGLSRNSFQSASLFGLEFFGEREQRIQGYSLNTLVKNEGATRIILRPRTAMELSGGEHKIVPDLSQNLDEDNTATIVLNDVSSAQVVLLEKNHDSSGRSIVDLHTSAIDLKLLSYHIAESVAHLGVRRIEQKACLDAIVEHQVVWISADWGMGEDGFLNSVRYANGEPSASIIRFSLEDYDGREAFLETIKSTFGASFQQICDRISDQDSTYILFDDIPLNNVPAMGKLPLEKDIELLAKSVRDYAPNARIVLRSRRQPQNASFPIVHLRPLDEADVALYLRGSDPGGSRYSTPEAIEALFRHTDGVPSRLDSALRQLEVGSLHDLAEANLDFSSTANHLVSAPRALVTSVAELEHSDDPNLNRAHGLLLALSTFPKGEQLTRIKRFYGPVPIHPTHALELRDRALIDSTPLVGMGEVDDVQVAPALMVPRPVREHVRSLLDSRSAASLDLKALVLYFGDDWKTGDIENSNIAKRTRNPLCNSNEISNAVTIIARALRTAADSNDDFEFEAAIRLGSSYVAALVHGDHYRSAVSLCNDMLPLIDHEKYCDETNVLRLNRARALRMAGDRVAARDEYLALNLDRFSKSQRQQALVGLALSYESLGDSEAESVAKRAIAIDRHSIPALQANVVLAQAIDDPVTRQAELERLLEISKKKKATTIQHNIMLTLAKGAEAKKPEKSREILREIIKLAGKNDDFYNKARAIVFLAKNRDRKLPFPADEKTNLINAYHFLYNERLTSLFDMCHDALWGIFESELDTPNLLNLFRHSSFMWRINGREQQEEKYIAKLTKSIHNYIDLNYETLGKDHVYFVVRVSVVVDEARRELAVGEKDGSAVEE